MVVRCVFRLSSLCSENVQSWKKTLNFQGCTFSPWNICNHPNLYGVTNHKEICLGVCCISSEATLKKTRKGQIFCKIWGFQSLQFEDSSLWGCQVVARLWSFDVSRQRNYRLFFKGHGVFNRSLPQPLKLNNPATRRNNPTNLNP